LRIHTCFEQRRATRRTNFGSQPRSIVPDALTPTPALAAGALAAAAAAASKTLVPTGPPEQTRPRPPPPPPSVDLDVVSYEKASNLNNMASSMGMGTSKPAIPAYNPAAYSVPAKVDATGTAYDDQGVPLPPAPPGAFKTLPSASESSDPTASRMAASDEGWEFTSKVATRNNNRVVLDMDGTGAAKDRKGKEKDFLEDMYSGKHTTVRAPKRTIASLDKFRLSKDKKPAAGARIPNVVGASSRNAVEAAKGCGVPAFDPKQIIAAPRVPGTANTKVAALIKGGATPSFVHFDPNNPDASKHKDIDISTVKVLGRSEEVKKEVVVRPKLPPGYSGLARFQLPFAPQKTAVSVLNELGAKLGKQIYVDVVEEKDENKKFSENYSFSQTDQKKWMQWRARFQGTVRGLTETPISGDWCITKSNASLVAAEKALQLVYASDPPKLWKDMQGKHAAARGLPAGKGPNNNHNPISEVNELLQRHLRGKATGPFLDWSYTAPPKGGGKGFIATCTISAINQVFTGDSPAPNKKDAQYSALEKAKKYIIENIYNKRI